MKHIIYISDFSMGGSDPAEKSIPRSGYSNIGMELCRGMSENGYDVIALGMGYTGQEHEEKFSIVPVINLQDAAGYMNNLKFVWGVDAVVVALDIHVFQEQLLPVVKKLELKYICITPLESDPLCPSWANLLMQMDKVFFISQLGADEAKKAGVEAEHIEIGIDTASWRLRTQEERTAIRKSLGFEEDDFVVMTVGDNQERKGLGRGMQIVSELKRRGVKVKHLLVTRENSAVGWKLYDLAYQLDISSELRLFNNGIPFADLYALYCSADAYLSCSRGEGLGLPVMEAMSIGIPVVANKTGALTELLADGRGFLIEPYSWLYDPFGNQRRYDIDVDKAVDALFSLVGKDTDVWQTARKYMESRDWKKSVGQLVNSIEEL